MPRLPRSLIALLATLLVLAACSSSDSTGGTAEREPGDSEAADAGTTSEDVEPQNFATDGPFTVGVTDLDLAGTPVVVFYPADPSGTSDAARYQYSGAEIFGEEIAALLPGAFSEPVEVDNAFVDVPASSDGPFPVVLFSHGFGSYYKFTSLHNAHLASWGFVVASVDHPTRSIEGLFTGAGEYDGQSDIEDLLATIDLLDAVNTEPDSLLEGAVDTEQIAAEGHSAGGRAVSVAAYDPRVDTWIGQAPGPPVDSAAYQEAGGFEEFDLESYIAEAEPPDKPSMIIAADGDIAIPLEEVEMVYDWLPSPKRLAVMENAGHNAFTDICQKIQEEGGLTQAMEQLGLEGLGFDELLELGEDGCLEENGPAEDGWELIDHLTVAQLRWVFGIDKAVAAASLQADYLDETFPGLLQDYQAL